MLPAPCRTPALVMVAAMQIMVLASQGRRAYSHREWTRLYVDTAREFFGSMEALMDYKEKNDTSATASTFEPVRRYIYDHTYMSAHI